jgi:hypothetical protein
MNSINASLPVELSSFTVNEVGNSTIIKWSTATELNNSGFGIERSTDKTVWTKLAFVSGNGTSNSIKNYSFTDNTISTSGKYYYRLKQVDNDGRYKYSNEIEFNFSSPKTYFLENNYPNPFNPSTLIRYAIPFDSNVQLVVYNSLGQIVKELISGVQASGYQVVKFDATSFSSGIYFYSIKAASLDGKNNFSSVKKMILIK